MKRTMYATCAEWFLWHVTMGREGEITSRSPSVCVVARSVDEAAAEAMEIAREGWKDEARWLKVLAVRSLHPINGMAAAPEEPAAPPEETPRHTPWRCEHPESSPGPYGWRVLDATGWCTVAMVDEATARLIVAAVNASPAPAQEGPTEEELAALHDRASGWQGDQTVAIQTGALLRLVSEVRRLRALPDARAEERLRAFAERYACPEPLTFHRYRDGSWGMTWRRTYPDGVVSDERATAGGSGGLAETLTQAEEWEAENDRREPEHAGRALAKGDGR